MRDHRTGISLSSCTSPRILVPNVYQVTSRRHNAASASSSPHREPPEHPAPSWILGADLPCGCSRNMRKLTTKTMQQISSCNDKCCMHGVSSFFRTLIQTHDAERLDVWIETSFHSLRKQENVEPYQSYLQNVDVHVCASGKMTNRAHAALFFHRPSLCILVSVEALCVIHLGASIVSTYSFSNLNSRKFSVD